MRWIVVTTLAAGAGLSALVACTPMPPAHSAAADFATLCAGCHGQTGKGIPGSRAADLTTLSRQNGGTFPRLQTMGKIYGYTMGRSSSDMPEFGQLLEGSTIAFDAGDGTLTPTPKRLVDLALYLEGLQQ